MRAEEAYTITRLIRHRTWPEPEALAEKQTQKAEYSSSSRVKVLVSLGFGSLRECWPPATSLHQLHLAPHEVASPREGGVGESKRKTWVDPLSLVTPPFSDIFALDSRTSALTVVVFLLFPNRPLWNHSLTVGDEPQETILEQKHKNSASTGEEGTTLSFRIWQPPSKLYQTPALPSLCRNVSFNTGEFYDPTFPLSWWHRGTKPSGDPMGHLPDSPPRCTLWAWHNFPVRRHGSLCRRVFCLGTKREREKKTIWIPSLKCSACVLLFCVRGSALLDGGDSCRFGKSSFKKASCN